MEVKFSPPDITGKEIDNVARVLRSGWITTGPETKLFESRIAKYCGTESAVCLNSATACLELSLILLGIKEGDEVITTAYTYTATASVIKHVGAKIVLIDTAPDSYEMDYEKMTAAINEKTRAIICVDIAGVPCDYDKIFAVINANKKQFRPNNQLQESIGRICVIADSAHSFGAVYKGKIAGVIADFTCFSFHAVKNLTTAEGGAVVFNGFDSVDSKEIYKQFMLLSLHGQSKDALAKAKIGSWEYDIMLAGHKCNMTDIMAAIGNVQLDRYGDLLKRRKDIIKQYNSGLTGKSLQLLAHDTADYSSSGHLYLTRVQDAGEEHRNKIIVSMAEKGISCNVHYKPLPLLTCYKNLGFDIKDYPNALNQYKNQITLPLHTLLTDEQVEYVINSYNDSIKNLR